MIELVVTSTKEIRDACTHICYLCVYEQNRWVNQCPKSKKFPHKDLCTVMDDELPDGYVSHFEEREEL